MKKADLMPYLQAAETAAKTAGELALTMQMSLGPAREKGEKDLVTEADMACDRHIRELLRNQFPHHNLITEELPPEGTAGSWTWYVDPIDGTINYSRGLPLWGVSVALCDTEGPLVGAIFLPVVNEMYLAQRGGGATLNGKPLRVSPCTALSKAILSHGDVNVGGPERHAELNAHNLKIIAQGAVNMQRVKCLGSAVTEGAYVAAGRMEGYAMPYFKPWDVAAAALLVTEAGGRITGLDGSEWSLNSANALFTNGILHEQMLAALSI